MDLAAKRSALPRAVIALGLVSLFTDVGSDMIFPLLPAFLAARFPDAPLLLGSMEGLAELVAAIFKWWSGRWADRVHRLRPLVVAGYSLSAAVRPLMGLVTAWWQPLLIRSTDRIGKGIRSSPRDAMISAWVPEGGRGRAFGFHRAMDNGGAALGALLAAALVGAGLKVEAVFLIAAIPGAVSVATLLLVAEPKRQVPVAAVRHSQAPVPGRLFAYLGPVAVFGLANSTDAFLLLKLTAEGAAPQLLPLAWLMLQAVKSLVSYPAGWVADRLGSASVVAWGWALYAVSYLGLALIHSVPATLAVIAFYGLYHGFSEGAERALLASLAPPESIGRAFGLYYALGGVAALVAGLGFGALWNWMGQSAAFFSAAVTAGIATVLLVALLPVARGGPAAAR
ncbi:MAG TPA: MFS transporter [Myxococcaceae bacterium]|nr:MFS transporter [Myxococcaceae bacterium]